MIRISVRSRTLLGVGTILIVLLAGQSRASAPAPATAASTQSLKCSQIDACRRAVAWQRHRYDKLAAALRWQREQTAKAKLGARVLDSSSLSPIEVGRELAGRRGWGGRQFACLVRLWSRESGWRVESVNRGGSGATGIPQALPGSKMASAGADWRTNAATQIRWGLAYIAARYGSPCAALANSDAHGYY